MRFQDWTLADPSQKPSAWVISSRRTKFSLRFDARRLLRERCQSKNTPSLSPSIYIAFSFLRCKSCMSELERHWQWRKALTRQHHNSFFQTPPAPPVCFRDAADCLPFSSVRKVAGGNKLWSSALQTSWQCRHSNAARQLRWLKTTSAEQTQRHTEKQDIFYYYFTSQRQCEDVTSFKRSFASHKTTPWPLVCHNWYWNCWRAEPRPCVVWSLTWEQFQ